MRFLFVTLMHWVLGGLMLAGVAISFANVVARYVFGHALFWAEEVLVFMMIWGVLLGTAAVAWEREHLDMDLISGSLSRRWKIALNAAMALLLVACCVFMVVQSWQVVRLFFTSGAVSVSAGVPKWIAHSALLAGFALTALAVLVRLRLYLFKKT